MLAFTLGQLYTLAYVEGKVAVRLELIRTYQLCGSIRETARKLSVSRNTARKQLRRYEAQGEVTGPILPPQAPPSQTPPEVKMLAFPQKTGEDDASPMP